MWKISIVILAIFHILAIKSENAIEIIEAGVTKKYFFNDFNE
jgi:hypothetical protein